MSVDPKTIHDYFSQYGWEYDYDEDSRAWVTGFRGDSQEFTIMLHLSDNWLYFIISPYVPGPSGTSPEIKEQCEARLYQHLLKINHAVNLAKFSLDSELDVVLTIELPTEGLTYSDFNDSMGALSYYADLYLQDLKALATDPNHVPEQSVEDDIPLLGFSVDPKDMPN